jgi:hypothetical protein
MNSDSEVRHEQGEYSPLIDPTVCATLSLPEAAVVLGIHRSTAWELHKRGEFPVPVLQIGHRLRVTKVQLQRYLMGPSTGEVQEGGDAATGGPG